MVSILYLVTYCGAKTGPLVVPCYMWGDQSANTTIRPFHYRFFPWYFEFEQNYFLIAFKFVCGNCYKITAELSCACAKICSDIYEQESSYSNMNFTANSNCAWKIISDTGPQATWATYYKSGISLHSQKIQILCISWCSTCDDSLWWLTSICMYKYIYTYMFISNTFVHFQGLHKNHHKVWRMNKIYQVTSLMKCTKMFEF